MRYSAVALHQAAMRDVIAGPEHVGTILETKLPEIREIRSGFADSNMVPVEDLPDTLRAQDEKFAHLHDLSRAEAILGIGLHQIMPPRANRSAVIDGYMEPTKVHCLIDNGHSTHTVPADQLDSLVLVADDASDHWRALGLMDSAVFVDPDRRKGILLTRQPCVLSLDSSVPVDCMSKSLQIGAHTNVSTARHLPPWCLPNGGNDTSLSDVGNIVYGVYTHSAYTPHKHHLGY